MIHLIVIVIFWDPLLGLHKSKIKCFTFFYNNTGVLFMITL